jgi:hypothetical protein
MIFLSDGMRDVGGVVEGDACSREGAVTVPVASHDITVGIYTFLIGDRAKGPMVQFFVPGSVAPMAEERRSAPVGRSGRRRVQHVHGHRSDSFRMQAERYILMGANHRYGERDASPGDAVSPLVTVIGDRGGIAHAWDNRREPNDVAPTRPTAEEMDINGVEFHDFRYHVSDEDAVYGMAASHAPIPSTSRLPGLLSDDDSWLRLRDGSTVMAVLLSDPEDGPLVLVSNNAPGAVEAMAGSCGTDRIRYVVEGSVTVGERTYRKGEFRATAAGVVEGPVVHGPEGSRQMLVVADRRHWLPVAPGADTPGACEHLDDIAAGLGDFVRGGAIPIAG